MSTTLGPISICAARTKRHLRDLCHEAERRSERLPDGVDIVYLREECLDRFNIWVSSLGVFQKGEASLDQRIPSGGYLAEEILRLLEQLEGFILELLPLVKGEREQISWVEESYTFTGEEFSDEEDEEAFGSEPINTPTSGTDEGGSMTMTESRDLCLSINGSLSSLLRLSIQIHKCSRRAKFSLPSTLANYDIGPDISHVKDRFPAAAENKALCEKLGKANAQRRQWLWYRKRHRDKLSVDHSGPGEIRLPWLKIGDASDLGSLARVSTVEAPQGYMPSLSGTKATTHYTRASESHAPSTYPETAFEKSSWAPGEDARLQTPMPPGHVTANKPFGCPYCCNIVEIPSLDAWQKHVHSDLSSYTCVFEDCQEMQFDSRRKWWAHEMEAHRSTWLCELCNSHRTSAKEMRSHILEDHPGDAPPESVGHLVLKFRRPLTRISASECPLCDYSSVLRSRGHSQDQISQVSLERFKNHLGRHLEQLALFVLPSTDLKSERDDKSDGQDPDDQDGYVSEGNLDQPMLREADLVQRLFDIASKEKSSPEVMALSPSLALRWQPPHDFTPPKEYFDTPDVDALPVRQEPIFGGDLFTPGWARGSGKRKEGFCARCPVSHWVNISDGSYRFHLTYFHGVPDSGVPLPRPSEIRPVSGKDGVWEGFCDACGGWRTLKKTRRGWNWFRHWLQDHADIVRTRTEESRQAPLAAQEELARDISGVELSQGELQTVSLDLFAMAASNKPASLYKALQHLRDSCSPTEMANLVNSINKDGLSLLLMAAEQGHERIVRLLLDAGADADLPGPDGRTALDYACDCGYFGLARDLIQHGADPSVSEVFKKILSNENEYAGERTEAVDQIPLSTVVDPEHLGMLSRAAFEGDVARVKKLVGQGLVGPSGCDLEEGAERGEAAFLLASIKGYWDVMETLLEHGANINTTSRHGWTPLMLAARRDHVECVAFLLRHGADVNHVSPDRWTALAEAASKGHREIMRMLLEAEADPEPRSQHDWTPLMHAAYRGDLDAVDLLMSHGASFDEISARDETVLLLASARGSLEVVERLLEAGCAPESEWSKIQGEVSTPDLGTSLKPQQRIERAYKVGWTPLMVACQVGSLGIVKKLLDAGANPHPKSPMFKTALEIAKENGRIEIVNYLEERLAVM